MTGTAVFRHAGIIALSTSSAPFAVQGAAPTPSIAANNDAPTPSASSTSLRRSDDYAATATQLSSKQASAQTGCSCVCSDNQNHAGVDGATATSSGSGGGNLFRTFMEQSRRTSTATQQRTGSEEGGQEQAAAFDEGRGAQKVASRRVLRGPHYAVGEQGPYSTAETELHLDEPDPHLQVRHDEQLDALNLVEVTSDEAAGHTSGWWAALIACIVCVLMVGPGVLTAGVMSGLTMGLVSLDPFDMELLMSTDPNDVEDAEERQELLVEQTSATAILPIVVDHHRLLVTLLLMNAIAAESLPLALDRLGLPHWATIMISVLGVLIFGEILPSSIFTGPKQLEIASFFVPFVSLLQTLLGVLVIPIARLLDAVLGKEHKGRYNKGELKALINLQLREHQQSPTGLIPDEIRMMTGAMELSRKTVADVMVPLNEVYMLPTSTELNMETMATIVGKGHSRLPIFNQHPHDIRGFLLVKNMIVVNPGDKRKLEGLGLRKPLVVTLDDPLLDLLTEFQKGKSHMAIVTNRPDLVKRAWATDRQIPVNVHMAGIVTLEDVIENLIGDDIRDESGAGEAGVREQLRKLIFKSKRVARVKEVTELAKRMFLKRTASVQRRRSSLGPGSLEGSPVAGANVRRQGPGSLPPGSLSQGSSKAPAFPYQPPVPGGQQGPVSQNLQVPRGASTAILPPHPDRASVDRGDLTPMGTARDGAPMAEQQLNPAIVALAASSPGAADRIRTTAPAATTAAAPPRGPQSQTGGAVATMLRESKIPANFPTHLTQALLQTRDKLAEDRKSRVGGGSGGTTAGVEMTSGGAPGPPKGDEKTP